MTDSPRIAIIGAGNVGGALGARLAATGATVKFGHRPGKNADDAVAAAPGATQAPAPEAAAWADVVFLAVPASAAVAAAQALGSLEGKVVVDCNNTLRWDDGPVWQPPPAGSLTAELAAALPGARLVKAFNTFGAEFHADPKLGDTSADVFLAGDDAAAKQTVAGIAERAGFNPVDCGPLRNAAVLENVAILWIHLAMREGRGRNFAIKLLSR
jgi:NADPH-dependent F420 reductase